MGIKDYIKIAETLGIRITFKMVAEDGTFTGMSRGDKLFFMENMARATMQDIRTYWEGHPDEDVVCYELIQLRDTIAAYKRDHSKIDFTDMMYRFLDEGVVPPIKVLIVDEAQDLTPLQWKVVEKLSENVEEVYIAGDDDQSIFKWAGADSDKFIKTVGTRRILEQSYRCPESVQYVAVEVISRITPEARVDKLWKARDAKGSVNYETGIENIDMSKGTWLLIARNVFLLDYYVQHCVSNGLIFEASTGSPISGAAYRAIRFWEQLRAGNEITAAQAKVIYEHMSVKVGVAYGFKTKLDQVDDAAKISLAQLRKDFGLLTTKPWDDALDKIPEHERVYFKDAMAKGESFSEPRIRINTIHGVKGGEADNVVVQTDMADRTFNEFQNLPDDEHRVWYVAVTRARENLFILSPKTNKHYQL
jgi:DNA helicase-2/ATP-dependent DNA helicase PcrA